MPAAAEDGSAHLCSSLFAICAISDIMRVEEDQIENMPGSGIGDPGSENARDLVPGLLEPHKLGDPQNPSSRFEDLRIPDPRSRGPIRSHPDELRRLMSMYQRGSLEAFEQVYAALAPSLRAYLTALTRNAAQADDLVQDTFLQVHRSRHTYRPDRPVRPWVFAIARHVWMMDLRNRSRRPIVAGEPSDVPVPSEVEGLADRDALRRALGSLLDDRREALLLHHVWGFSFAEIGQMLGIRADAAKLRSSRGMNDLRARLRPELRDA
jgi:RNA polymerase sigma-70 factor, ECF subfamily